MAMKFSVAVRNARLDAVESTIGTTPLLQIFTGTEPTNITDADSGTKLVEMTLPSDWMAAASAASKAKSGTWQSTGITNGTAGYFRVKNAASPFTTHIQGNITATGGGGVMELDNTSIATSQQVTVTTFTLTAGNP